MPRSEKWIQSRVVLIAGAEDALRREALTEILRAANVQADDFDLETFSGDTSGPSEWMASVGTAPFLGERRVAIVRHLLRFDPEKGKSVSFIGLPPTSLLILVADDEGGSEERDRRSQTLRTNWQKAVEAAGGAVVSCDMDGAAAKAAIKKRAQDRGLDLSGRALDVLMEMTGNSFSRALAEIEKLELFLGESRTIREADVNRVVAASRDWDVYRMVDGIFADNPGQALRQLRILVGSASRAEEAAFGRILPVVSRQIRQLWQAKLCVEANCSPGKAPPEVRASFPERYSIASDSPYRQNAAMAVARTVSFDRLRRGFRILADTDARLKGALDSFSAIETLERMVLEMAEP